MLGISSKKKLQPNIRKKYSVEINSQTTFKQLMNENLDTPGFPFNAVSNLYIMALRYQLVVYRQPIRP